MSYNNSSAASPLTGAAAWNGKKERDDTAFPKNTSKMNEVQSPLQRYLSRRFTQEIRTNDLPLEKSERGVYTATGIFYFTIKLIVPLAYMYIVLLLLRELCIFFPNSFEWFLRTYLPFLYAAESKLKNISRAMEVWAVIEGIFYICLMLQLKYLQYKDPLEASLSCAPMKSLQEREELYKRIMDAESEDPTSYITGWFFDCELESIGKYDVLDFMAWGMFEGRNQEHLSSDEVKQLDGFVEELEWRISRQLYGLEDAAVKGGEDEGGDDVVKETDFTQAQKRPLTKNNFHFHDCSDGTTHTSFFNTLYENYKTMYEQYRKMLPTTDFLQHPVQDLCDYVSEKKQQMEATAENAYFTLVDKGSNVDKQLSALSHNAWQEVKKTFQFFTKRKQALMQQLQSYRTLLETMRESSAVPSTQMAQLMRKITQCNDAMERIEHSALDALHKATGGCIDFATRTMHMQKKEPVRYAKYSSDPLLGVSTYPLIFHLFILALTDGGLRLIMKMRGFERRNLGNISYYYHPGKSTSSENEDDDDLFTPSSTSQSPIVFVHGIGVGLIYYLKLLDPLLDLGRPLFLPEIPYVTGFRNWLHPNSVLPPAGVASTLTTMLATHGFLRASFIGHSYGTSWLSYMCKLAPSAMDSVVFLDPICFCLHAPFVTKNFVYHRANPGSSSYCIRTDIMINWTIQRNFPWQHIALFVEEIGSEIPCAVFLSDKDTIVPTSRVHNYLQSKQFCTKDHSEVQREQFLPLSNTTSSSSRNLVLFHGVGHADWIEVPSMIHTIVDAMDCFHTGRVVDR